jgi:hypothetical protein
MSITRGYMKNKLRNYLNKLSNLIRKRLGSIELNLSGLLTKLSLVFVILVLGYNIYISYNKGVENLKRIDSEETKLGELIEENRRLSELEKYYSSAEFGLAYAKESWNLAEPGSTLFYIPREQIQEVEKLSDELDPIPVNDHQLWWKRLILGI